MRTVTVAKHAGFCFGVSRATERLERALSEALPGEKVCTLGHLIHNETYNDSLRRRGVLTVAEEDLLLHAEVVATVGEEHIHLLEGVRV